MRNPVNHAGHRQTRQTMTSIMAITTAAAAVIVLSDGAMAAAPEVFEEILVTARKRSENIQTVPISMTALSAQAVADRGALRIRDLQSATPNVIFPFAENNSLTIITVRGINSQPRQNVGTDAGLGVYVDGVVMGRLTSFNQEVYDIERVEFLRGPQGTLFGKNATTGAINIVTKTPALDRLTGAAGVKISDFDETNFFGYLSGPLIENTLGASISAFRNKRGGYMFNQATGNKIGTDDSYGGRLKLHYNSGDNLQITLVADYLKDDSVSPGPQRILGPFSTTEKYVVNFDEEPLAIREIAGVSATIDYDLGINAKITSITAYRKADNTRSADADGTPLAQQTSNNISNQDQWSQELRVASTEDNFIEYVAGLYYYNQDIYGSTLGTITGLGSAEIFGTVKTKAYAAFASLDFNLTDRITLTTGIRYTREEKDLNYQQNGITPFIPFLPRQKDELNDDDLSPTISLKWQVTDSAMLYGVISRGYKSGGWNLEPITSAIINNFTLTRFTAESLWNYEIGAKTAWFDNRLILNVSAFQYAYDNIQISQRVELPPPYAPGTFANLVTNAAEATSKGVEVEMQARPIDDLLITGGFGYVDATYDSYIDGADNFAGNRLNNAPKWTANLSGQYTLSIGNLGSLMFRADYSYISTFYTERVNDPAQNTPGRSLVNLKVRYTDPSEHFELSVYSTNVFNNTYIENRASNTTNTIKTLTYGRPRIVGVEAIARF